MLVRSLIYGWGFDFMRPFQDWEIGFCLSPNFYARSEDVEPEKTAMRSFHRVLRCRKLTTGTNSAQNRFKVPVNTS